MIDIALIVAGTITQMPNPGHRAWDIACPANASVYAAFDGEVRVHRSVELGNQVTLIGDGRNALYAHLESSIENGTVKKGDVIGTCGNSGTWTTGRHLHFEVY